MPSRMDVLASEKAREAWDEAKEAVKGSKHQGHGRPRNPEERLKAGVPYSEQLSLSRSDAS